MTTKRITDLTAEELRKVYDNNTKLRENVFNDFLESADYNVSEVLDVINSGNIIKSYEIGYCGSYANGIRDVETFLDNVLEADRIFGILTDPQKAFVYKVKRTYNHYYTDYRTYIGRFDDFFDSAADKILDIVVAYLRSYYNFSEEDLTEYFIDFYVDERLDAECYVDENYNLYEHIEYEKCYA